jgi:hypothetical protein
MFQPVLKNFPRFNDNRPVFEPQHQLVIQVEAANVAAWFFTGEWDGGTVRSRGVSWGSPENNATSSPSSASAGRAATGFAGSFFKNWFKPAAIDFSATPTIAVTFPPKPIKVAQHPLLRRRHDDHHTNVAMLCPGAE